MLLSYPCGDEAKPLVQGWKPSYSEEKQGIQMRNIFITMNINEHLPESTCIALFNLECLPMSQETGFSISKFTRDKKVFSFKITLQIIRTEV